MILQGRNTERSIALISILLLLLAWPLFANPISWGHSEWRIQEQTQPEKHFAVITLDTLFEGQVIEIRNNNIFWDQEITGVESFTEVHNSTLRNYPNPFNNATIIAYELEGSSDVTLEVYDITGRSVRSLVSEFQSAGSYEVSFDAAGLSGGMYFYKLDNGSMVQVNNMIISK